jgi:Cu-Zn family superoxide dismutase
VISESGHQGGRHRNGRVAHQSRAWKRFGWRRTAAAIVSVGVAVLTAFALSSPAGADVLLAKATLFNAGGAKVGEVFFQGHGMYADRVTVEINAPDILNRGSFHGFHVHSAGVCDGPSFTSAGGHLNPGNAKSHGAHQGDLPSVLLTNAGQAYAEFETPRLNVADLFDSDGSAVVLHVGADNFANIPTRYAAPPTSTSVPLSPVLGPDDMTLANGDAGGRYACGVVLRATS